MNSSAASRCFSTHATADKRYVSDFSTVADARTANTSVFYPGVGRAFYAGVKFKF